MSGQQYLGDSVYVETEGNLVKLTTNNGFPDDPRNVIFMEMEVVALFLEWIDVNLKHNQDGEREKRSGGIV